MPMRINSIFLVEINLNQSIINKNKKKEITTIIKLIMNSI